MTVIRADDDPRLKKTAKFIFLCPKTRCTGSDVSRKNTEEESISPCFQIPVRSCMNSKKKSLPIDIFCSETAACTLMLTPKQLSLTKENLLYLCREAADAKQQV